ncbi:MULTISPECIES: hypothetical protein [unclassified Crossiella]|uniref:hypothetical protein n=1 Tax=unclassified Crossiella TaxID=2620835 RepID=UPI0020003C11|nr:MULTISPECIES: hypothetical protein [unclassified Crossiella]MCK2243710.1 hypothetical protein [Crossiella sp. S99.2]MCK2257569.1 hypothetical protein [Crossiella sp. S99.1]
MTNANPLPANVQHQLDGPLFQSEVPSPVRGGHLDRGDETVFGLETWFFVQVLYSSDPGTRMDVHLVRRRRTPEHDPHPRQFPLLCKGTHSQACQLHEVQIQPNFRGRPCLDCLRVAVPGNTDPDLVDFYGPILQTQGWRWGVQLSGAVEPSLTLIREPWLTSLTLPSVGASIVVRLPNSWNAEHPRDLGPERFRFLVPIGTAVEWAATADLNDTTALEAAAAGGRG